MQGATLLQLEFSNTGMIDGAERIQKSEDAFVAYHPTIALVVSAHTNATPTRLPFRLLQRDFIVKVRLWSVLLPAYLFASWPHSNLLAWPHHIETFL